MEGASRSESATETDGKAHPPAPACVPSVPDLLPFDISCSFCD